MQKAPSLISVTLYSDFPLPIVCGISTVVGLFSIPHTFAVFNCSSISYITLLFVILDEIPYMLAHLLCCEPTVEYITTSSDPFNISSPIMFVPGFLITNASKFSLFANAPSLISETVSGKMISDTVCIFSSAPAPIIPTSLPPSSVGISKMFVFFFLTLSTSSFSSSALSKPASNAL